MEKLIFVGIVFAIGIIVYSFWQLIEAQRVARKAARDNSQPFPPRKRTISGQDPVEEAQIAFQRRIEHWQRTQMPRWSGLRRSADELTGEKYTFVPEPRQPRPVRGGLRDVGPVRQHFELVG